jgi:HEAT repeat protein
MYFRIDAVNALAKLGSREDLPLIRKMLRDLEGDVQAAAVEAFSELGSREDIPEVRALLKAEDREVRRAAVEAITNLAGEEDLDDLAKLAVKIGGVLEEPMEALGAVDQKVYSSYALSEEQELW